MKRFLFSVMTFMLMGSLSAQNVARECVLFEVFTGVNCPYCPAAANGINQMMEEGLAIAPVAVHTSAFSTSDFYTDETNARANFYGVTSYPTLKADGIRSTSGGGGADESMYSYYMSHYNNRINIPSPFTIDLSYEYLDGANCQVTAVVNKVGECTAGNLKVMIALTESHINRAWQGMSELNAVTRDFIPTQNGTAFSGDSQTVTGVFSMEGFPKENMHLVAWIQSFTTKEVFQAVRISMANDNLNNDVAMRGVSSVVTNNCSGLVEPVLKVKALGKETVTSMTIEARDENDVLLTSYDWSGEVNQNESVEINLSEFNIQDANILKLNVVKVNGVDDEQPFDNFMTKTMGDAIDMDGTLKFQVKTPKDPEELAIDIENMETGELIEHYTFDQGSHAYKFDKNLPSAGCFRLTIRNPKGNGNSGGFGQIKDASGKTIVNYSATNNVFTYRLGVEMNAIHAAVDENIKEELYVYPNPASSQVYINTENLSRVDVYNAAGQLVLTKVVDNCEIVIDVKSFEDGVYVFNMTTADGVMSIQRIVIKK